MTHTIQPADLVEGEVEVPGDKSISHRALLISALAEGTSHVENINPGQDVASTAECLRALGVEISEEEGQTRVCGRGLQGLEAPGKTMDSGNSGTTMRLLSGILAGQPFLSRITGDDSIKQRPMARIIEPLRRMGAEVSGVRDEFAPLTISGGGLRAIDYQLPVASAQVKSCVLLAGLYADGKTSVAQPAPTRDHTELMLAQFGATVQRQGLSVSVEGGARLRAQNIFVPGDLSSAAYFIAAAMLVRESGLLIKNIGVNPTRNAFLSLISDVGAQLDIMNVRNVDNEMVADLFVRNSSCAPVTIGGSTIPQVIDEIPIMAILATQAHGTTRIIDAGELRHKESDRLRSLKFNLDRMGARVEEKRDGLVIEGPTQLHGAEIECFGDHRIAMAFAVAGLVADGETRLKGSECVDTSYTDFFSTLEALTSGGATG